MASASLRISTFYLGLVILGLFSARLAVADEVSEIAQNPEIEAKAYELKTIRPSRSGRVYLFQKTDTEFPVDGKIFLLRKGETPVMAFRVLKTYPATKQIAAKKLLPYEGFASLDRGSEYRAYEKIGDKVIPVPPSSEDLKDLKELESGNNEELPPAPEEETREGLTEAPPAEALPPQEAEKPEAPRYEDVEIKGSEDEDDIEENESYFPNFFTMAVGLLENAKVPGPDPKFGGGILYSRKLGDSIAGEAGFYYYKSTGEINGTTISTTIMPLIGNVRYEHRYSDLFTGYLYAGLMYPWIASNLGATAGELRQIAVLSPALGVGVFLQTGPNWYLRLNLGTESMTLGATLRF